MLIDANGKLGYKDGEDSLWVGQQGPDQATDQNGEQRIASGVD